MTHPPHRPDLHRRTWSAGLAALALLPAARLARAAEGPASIVVPFPPGGTTDLLARAVSQALAERLQRPVLVENKAGAGGSVGAGLVAKAEPNGATLLMATVGTQAINQHLYKLAYDPVTDLAAISRVGNVANVLVVNPALPVRSVPELIRHAKEHPGQLTFGSAGNGTTMHLTGEMFSRRAGVAMVHVPYRGSGPAMTDLMAGQISMIFENLPTALPQIQAGKVRALAVTSSARAKVLPAVPTIDESALAGFNATSWFGLFVPAKTPPALVNQLHAHVKELLAEPAMDRKLQEYGVEPFVDASPAAFRQFIEAETRKWGEVVRLAGVKAD